MAQDFFLKSTPRLSYVIGVEKSFFGIAGTFPIGKHVKKLKKTPTLVVRWVFVCFGIIHEIARYTKPDTTENYSWKNVFCANGHSKLGGQWQQGLQMPSDDLWAVT